MDSMEYKVPIIAYGAHLINDDELNRYHLVEIINVLVWKESHSPT